jgi:hypothetical protein
MTYAEPRPAAQRKADALARLTERELDGWVASSGAAGAHLVPLSLVWTDERVVIAVEASSVTARNIVQSRAARIGVGPTRDVVLIDAVVDRAVPAADAGDLAAAYAAQADWDPSSVAGDFLYLVLKPVRIQAWRESNELSGRTLMRAGTWIA